MSDADDYIQVITKFEKLRDEYLEWVAQADHILNLLRHVDGAGNTGCSEVLGDQLRPGVGTVSTSIS